MSELRKEDHLSLALKSPPAEFPPLEGLYYEPLLSPHPPKWDEDPHWEEKVPFLGKFLGPPLWVSSMTGGGPGAREINMALARAAAKYGLPMALGSCRPLLEGRACLEDFHMRPIMGPEGILLANIGIAQLEGGEFSRLEDLLGSLEVDGLVAHVNPLQEWAQREGDPLSRPPLETLEDFLESCSIPLVVKEVGQGMGPKSLKALLGLPLVAVELAGLGGTNFTHIEHLRGGGLGPHPLERVGHGACEMISWMGESDDRLVIISGGVRDFVHGHYLRLLLARRRPRGPSVIGHAGRFLKWALRGDGPLEEFIEGEINGHRMAQSYLFLKEGSL